MKSALKLPTFINTRLNIFYTKLTLIVLKKYLLIVQKCQLEGYRFYEKE